MSVQEIIQTEFILSEKVCTKCKVAKPLSLYFKDKQTKGGFYSWCKACTAVRKKIYNAKFHEENREERNSIRRERYWSNRDAELASMKKWRTDNANKIKHADRKNREADPRKNMLANAKGRAKRRNVEFTLTLNDIIIPEKCPVFGLPLVLGTKKAHAFSPSLDRIDNSKGYVLGNVIVVSHKANTMKNNASAEELYSVAEFYLRIAEPQP